MLSGHYSFRCRLLLFICFDWCTGSSLLPGLSHFISDSQELLAVLDRVTVIEHGCKSLFLDIAPIFTIRFKSWHSELAKQYDTFRLAPP